MSKGTDTVQDSERLARKIRAYWEAKGFTVKTEAGTAYDFGETTSNFTACGVRSNMIGGLPNPNPEAPVFKKRRSVLLKTANGIERVFVGQLIPEGQP